MMCYYSRWSLDRAAGGKISIENIDPCLCTHLVYAFAGLSEDNRIKPLGEEIEEIERYKELNSLRKINPNLTTLISIGGEEEDSLNFSRMAADDRRRRVFMYSVIQFLRRCGFNGLDMRWVRKKLYNISAAPPNIYHPRKIRNILLGTVADPRINKIL